MLVVVFSSLMIGAPNDPLLVLNKVQTAYKKAGNITAQFEQTYTDKIRGRSHSEKGQLSASADGKIRWSYTSPQTKDFVFDGKNAFFYEPDDAQVTIFDSFEQSPLSQAVHFLWGQGKLLDNFSPTPCTNICEPNSASQISLGLKPSKPIPTIDRIALVVDAKTYRVKKSTVLDPLGNRTDYVFTDLVFQATVKPEIFAFSIPEGVNVLRATMPAQKH